MRKIEAKMNKALRHFENWSSGNTSVISTKEEMKVFLHGNHIATLDKATMDLFIFDGGWHSVTTKSRLNGLLKEFRPDRQVFLKNWQWFVSDFLGMAEPFFSGMTV